jgi:hypothetical protein
VEFVSKESVSAVLLDGEVLVAGNEPWRTDWYTIAVETKSETEIEFALTVTYTAPKGIPLK